MQFSINNLNQHQLAIAKDTYGPILVTAGAGSGKTRLLTHRICNMIENENINPFNILAITFTNKATNEMKERLVSMLPQSSGVWVSTFHSMCVRILRNDIENLGYSRNFSIYDESDKEKILKTILKQYNLEDNDLKGKISWHISNAKNLGLNPIEYLNEIKYEPKKDVIYKCYDIYEKEMKKNNSLDFDDLLMKTLELFYQFPNVLDSYQNKFKFILVDEFQDTNIVQYKIVKMLSDKYKNIFVVGDEDQCIYSWRGANIENINNFIKDYKCKIYKLEQNYRSTKTIIDYANKLIKNNNERLEKTLFSENEQGEDVVYYSGYDDNEEADFVARNVSTLIKNGVNPKEIGVLMRVSAMSRLIEEKLLNYNAPFTVSGLFKFFERMEIKNVLAYLKIVLNPKDSANILRVINFPKRGIGNSTIEKLQNISQSENKSLYDIILEYSTCDLLSNAIKVKVGEFAKVLEDINNLHETLPLGEFVKELIKVVGIRDEYASKSEEDYDRLLNIDQLVQSVQTFEKQNPEKTLIDYIESITLQSDMQDENEDKDAVSVSTVHASKGLEFDYVFIIGVEEGKFPLSRAIEENDLEEERRLMYVAITRARKKLYITRAKRRFMYGSYNDTMDSRFTKEMGLVKNQFASSLGRFVDSDNYNSDYGFSNYSYNTNSYTSQGYSAESYSNNSYNSNYNKSTYEYKKQDFNKLISKGFDNVSFSNGLKTKQDFSAYKVGVKVSHTKFGEGIITKIENLSGNAYVYVDFNSVGMKSLCLQFAPLNIIE